MLAILYHSLAKDMDSITLSFYRYVRLENPADMRQTLLVAWESLGVLGRVYLAHEGINAQVAVPAVAMDAFRASVDALEPFAKVPFKIAVQHGPSFEKLRIKVRPKLVADGIEDTSFDVTDVGTHLDAQTFNALASQEDVRIVDMRNQYESRIGHFQDAHLPDADTFEQALPMAKALLGEDKDAPVLLYCTGGIRCEKASAYLKHHGYKRVHQLHGGIIQYAHDVREQGLPNLFRGKNFVFDNRLAERISDDVVSHCDQCSAASDDIRNCANDMCHVLFIQCSTCALAYGGACSDACKQFLALPEAERRAAHAGNAHPTARKGIREHTRYQKGA